MAVGTREGTDPGVFAIDHDSHRTAWTRTLTTLGGRLVHRDHISRLLGVAVLAAGNPVRYWNYLMGHEDMSFPGTRHILSSQHGFAPDIVHLHNLHGGYFDLRALPAIATASPLLLTMHDAWMLTGHCAHSLECRRWVDGCGSCPNLDYYVPIRRDGSRYNLDQKRRVVSEVSERGTLRVAAPSHWLLRQAEQSVMSPFIEDFRVIPNGVNPEVFSPGSRAESRHLLGIPQDRFVVLTVAHNMVTNPHKDFAALLQAMSPMGLETDQQGRAPLLVVLGDDGAHAPPSRCDVLYVPYQSDQSTMAKYYRAADIYVHPSKVESFALTIVEAMLCGIPVVASAVGGVPELVSDGSSGLLVPAESSGLLAAAITTLRNEPETLRKIAEGGRERSLANFTLHQMVNRYASWYDDAHTSVR